MSPALSNRPIKGTVFFFCAAAHAAILLLLAQAGIPGTGIAAGPARDTLVPVKIFPRAMQRQPDKTPAQADSSRRQATHRRHSAISSSRENTARDTARPQRPVSPENSAKTVTPIVPLIANPLGQGSWGFARPAPAVPSEVAMANMQQERAAFRMALMDRLSVWMSRQTQAHRDSDCLIRLSQASHQAQLSCASNETESTLWPALSGLIIPGEPRPEDTICVAAGNGHLEFIDCDRKPGNRSEK